MNKLHYSDIHTHREREMHARKHESERDRQIERKVGKMLSFHKKTVLHAPSLNIKKEG